MIDIIKKLFKYVLSSRGDSVKYYGFLHLFDRSREFFEA